MLHNHEALKVGFGVTLGLIAAIGIIWAIYDVATSASYAYVRTENACLSAGMTYKYDNGGNIICITK